MRRRMTCLLVIPILAALCASAPGADWPTWRYDAARSSASPEELPAELHQQWTRALPPPAPAWPFDGSGTARKLNFDWSYEPIVLGKMLYIGSSRSDSVTAYDTATGEVRWRFITDGPVRFAPAGWKDKLYVVSDDGHLYCLDAKTGRLVWRFRGAPTARKLLGNGRLISAWPARGGPVVDEGKVTFAAGVWPFMGIFIYCLDAETGAAVWSNEETGHQTLAPQGYLVVSSDRLLVPCGRGLPGMLDKRTGRMHVHPFTAWATTAGCRPRFDGYRANAVFATRKYYSASGTPIDLVSGIRVVLAATTGAKVGDLGANSVVADGVLYTEHKDRMTAYDLDGAERVVTATFDPDNPDRTRYTAKRIRALRNFAGKRDFVTVKVTPRWTLRLRNRAVHGDFEARKIIAGSRLYHGVNNTVTVYDVASKTDAPKVVQTIRVPGTIGSLIAGDGRLFIVTTQGRLWCYGAETQTRKDWARGKPQPAPAGKTIEETLGVDGGYAVLLSTGGDLGRVDRLTRTSKRHWIVIEPDASFVDKLRVSVPDYGARVHVLCGDPLAFDLPPCAMNLMLIEDRKVAARIHGRRVRRLVDYLHPYGGKLAVRVDDVGYEKFRNAVHAASHPNAGLKRQGDYAVLTRTGGLPGSGEWTHHEGDAGNTRFSQDALVKPPFSVLWFGASDRMRHLDRHTRHPRPLVTGGRIFIECAGELNAADIYTGRFLWQRKIPQLAKPFDTWLWQPGAQSLGGDMVAYGTSIWIVSGDRTKCLVLDAVTGEPAATLTIPDANDPTRTLRWGTIRISDGRLIAGARPLDERWNYDFRASAFPKGAVPAFVKRIGTWEGFETAPKPPGGSDLDFVLANLNRLLKQRAIAKVLPREVTAKVDADALKKLTHRIATLEAVEAPDRRRRLQRLAANRDLLRRCYPELPTLDYRKYTAGGWKTWEDAASHELVVMRPATGEVLWRHRAKTCFRHTAMAGGNGRVYVIDRWPPGLSETGPSELVAFDARSGEMLWRKTEDVTGGFLAYSGPRDVLVQSFGYTNTQLVNRGDIVRGQTAYRGATGRVLWRRRQGGYHRSLFVLHDRYLIATNGERLDIETGKTLPVSGVPQGSRLSLPEARLGGCGNPIGSTHLLTGRAGCAWQHNPHIGSAGFYSLDVPIGNQYLGGFRAGCTADLIAAGGVLNAYNTGFDCYCLVDQVKGALAVMHDRDAESWCYLNDRYAKLPAGLRRVGVNFGAPGYRISTETSSKGTLWLAYPGVDMPGLLPRRSLVEDLKVAGDVTYHYRHALRLRGDGLRWVAASYAKGAGTFTLALKPPAKNTRYTVQLHFSEPDGLKPGERVFHVKLQNRTVLKSFDIARLTGGANRALVTGVNHIAVDDALTVELVPQSKAPPVLSGIEVLVEE